MVLTVVRDVVWEGRVWREEEDVASGWKTWILRSI